jgi:outer membrane protein assembly factor BamB
MNLRVFILLSALILCGTFTALRGQTASPVPTTARDSEAYQPLKRCWEYEAETSGRVIVAASEGSTYVGESDGRVRAMSTRTGSVVWSTELGGQVTALVAVPHLGVAVITSRSTENGGSSTLRLLNSGSGLVQYSIPIDVGDGAYLFAVRSRLIAADPSGQISAYDSKSGEVQWQIKLPFKLSARPAVLEESLVVGTVDKKVIVITIGNGKLSSSFSTDRQVSSIAIRENGMIVVGDDRGNVTNFRDSTGSVWWRFKSGGRIGTIIGTSGGILVGSYDNFVYMLSRYNGDVKWKRRLEGRVVSAPAILDKYVLVASSTEISAQVLDTESGKPVDQLQFGENNFVVDSPIVSDGNFTVFPLTSGLATFSSTGCADK